MYTNTNFISPFNCATSFRIKYAQAHAITGTAGHNFVNFAGIPYIIVVGLLIYGFIWSY